MSIRRTNSTQPVDGHGVGAVAQRHRTEPAIAADEALAPALDPHAMLGQFDAGPVLLDRRVGVRLEDELEVPLRRFDRRAERLRE